MRHKRIEIGGNESMKNYRYLNLEQKMLRIRRKMPTLLKRFYNDEADYDFATLDDIYEAMTPALNKYGVNFDIVREIPTQYDESGHQTYLVRDKDDYWRYEADVELCWTNADRPEECRHVTIHITETNEIPDKAHGTALTYGLKYYFRNKFCILLYGYSPTRSGSYAKEFLKGYHGYLETDGYQGYNGLPDIKRCSCWAHIRRYFIDAVPKGKQYDYSQRYRESSTATVCLR